MEVKSSSQSSDDPLYRLLQSDLSSTRDYPGSRNSKDIPHPKMGSVWGLLESSESNDPIRMKSEKSQQKHSCGVDTPLQSAALCSCITVSKELEFLKW